MMKYLLQNSACGTDVENFAVVDNFFQNGSCVLFQTIVQFLKTLAQYTKVCQSLPKFAHVSSVPTCPIISF